MNARRIGLAAVLVVVLGAAGVLAATSGAPLVRGERLASPGNASNDKQENAQERAQGNRSDEAAAAADERRQQPERRFESDPRSGPPGTVISVSGTGCFAPWDLDRHGDYVQVLLSLRQPPFTAYEDNFIDVAEDGSWSGTVTVPDEAERSAYEVVASCIVDSEPAYPYKPTTFTVTAG